jgi:hypothetical protein
MAAHRFDEDDVLVSRHAGTGSESRDCGFEVSATQAIAAAAKGHAGGRLDRVEPRLVDIREIEPFFAHERGQPVSATMKRSAGASVRQRRTTAASDMFKTAVGPPHCRTRACMTEVRVDRRSTRARPSAAKRGSKGC